MGKFREYNPEQALLLPPSVRDILGEQHLCFFVHDMVERLDIRAIERSYSDQGHPGYHPRLLLKLWLYAYALGITSSRRLEQRTREDLGFRYLAGGAEPDHWSLNAFRRRHARALNDVFTQVVEFARQQGWARLGHVAIDSTRIAANASRDRIVTPQKLRRERARIRRQIRRWQQQCNSEQSQESSGTQMPERWRQRLEEIPRQLERLRKAGVSKQSATDPDSRFLRQRQGFVLGYTADIAVSEDHFIVAQRVTQAANDVASLQPMVEQIGERCRADPGAVSADSGFFATGPIEAVSARGIEVWVPDTNLACELNGGARAERVDGCVRQRSAVVAAMRRKLRSAAGRVTYQLRKSLVEPVFGVLKEQRHGRRFRLRGLEGVGAEFCWMASAYNLTRLHRLTLAG